jgi:hypothetical protein
MKGAEIAVLRKAGTPVTVEVLTPVLAFVCDTSIEVLRIAPRVLEYPVVIIECSKISFLRWQPCHPHP